MKLEDIGFYTLSDHRAKYASAKSPIYRAELLITKKCNFSCSYCRGIGEELSKEDIVNFIHILQKDGLKNIRFSGGEPTIKLDVLKTGIKASNGCDHIAISTNGSADYKIYKELANLGVNDFSISLDACCAAKGDSISGVNESWSKVVDNIKRLSSDGLYVSVGIVLHDKNVNDLNEIIEFAIGLGVSDIRPIPASQWATSIKIPKISDDKYPILNYRFKQKLFRGNPEVLCPLVLDDVAIKGNYHYPCIIYMREGGKPIGLFNDSFRLQRYKFYKNHKPQEDSICSSQCLDVCRDYNNKFIMFKNMKKQEK